MIQDKPWLGQGFAQMKAYSKEESYQKLGLGNYFRKYNAHNIYLQTLSELGIIGSLVLLLLLFGITRALYYEIKLHQKQTSSQLHKIFLLSFIVNLLHGVTQNTFYDANVVALYLGLFWFNIWYQSNDKK